MNTAITYYDLPAVEQQVTELYACGLTKKEIAVIRNRSIHTVDNQLKVIFSKTGTRKDTELAAWYFCTRFKLTLDLPEVARKMIALCMLALVGFGMMTDNCVLRTFRSAKVTRVTSCRIKRNDNAFYYEN